MTPTDKKVHFLSDKYNPPRDKLYLSCVKMFLPHGIEVMENKEEVIEQFGKRVQRCYGCLIAFHMKDLYLGDDITYYCEHCKDDTMFHFDDYTKVLDISKLREVADEHHH